MRTETEPRPLIPTYQERAAIQPEQIPHELFSYTQWVCWRYVDRGEGRKPDKQPVNPRTLANAGVHWDNTWTSFEEAHAIYLRYCSQTIHGIGLVLTHSDPYVAVDLDSCIQGEKIEDTAAQIISDLGSYTEVSPSGHGLRILLACPEFQDNARRTAIEVYSHSRYVTVTGHHVAGTPPTISAVSGDLITSLLPTAPEPAASPPPQVSRPERYAVDNTELWERIFTHDKFGSASSRMINTGRSIYEDFRVIARLTGEIIRSPSFAF
jgi:putative DNA primase/helicase